MTINFDDDEDSLDKQLALLRQQNVVFMEPVVQQYYHSL